MPTMHKKEDYRVCIVPVLNQTVFCTSSNFVWYAARSISSGKCCIHWLYTVKNPSWKFRNIFMKARTLSSIFLKIHIYTGFCSKLQHTFCTVYHFTAAQGSHSCDSPPAPIISTITYRRNAPKKKWYSAGSLRFLSQPLQDWTNPLHFDSDSPQDGKSSDLTHSICVVIIKCPTTNLLIFKN
jgi:hypothetical protein